VVVRRTEKNESEIESHNELVYLEEVAGAFDHTWDGPANQERFFRRAEETGGAMSSPTEQLFQSRPGVDNHLWGIVLAGGEGRRLQPFIKTFYGQNYPKQYCAIVGTRSMLRHTLDRVERLFVRQQILTVVNRTHLPYALIDLAGRPVDTLVVQPCGRETAPGILLPLLRIWRRDSSAVVAIFPSDHFIIEEGRFMEHVVAGCRFAESFPGYLLSLAIRPDEAKTGYGWIERGELVASRSGYECYSVRRFLEKPDLETTRSLHAGGSLCNTMTMIGEVRTFLDIFRVCTPDLFTAFTHIARSIGTPEEAEVIEATFGSIPSLNFSSSVLQQIPERLGVIPVRDVYWSDWGEEHRIRADFERFGYAFPQVTPDDHFVPVHALP
jgi:mannose-1-phosphate guanylyltransferase